MFKVWMDETYVRENLSVTKAVDFDIESGEMFLEDQDEQAQWLSYCEYKERIRNFDL